MDEGLKAQSHPGDAVDDVQAIMTRWSRRAVVAALALAPTAALSVRPPAGKPQAIAMIDQRVETLGIAGWLAGLDEFVTLPPSPYSAAIRRRFARFAQHPLVVRLRAADADARREGAAISAWDVMSLALHLGAPPDFKPLVGYEAPVEDAWDGRRLFGPQEVEFVRAFHRDAGCASFFAEQGSFLGRVERHMRQRLTPVYPWVEHFFGLPPTERYVPVLSLLGLADYGYFRVNYGSERRDTCTMFAVRGIDPDGAPTGLDAQAMMRMILHETVHSFANQVIDRNLATLLPVAEQLLARPTVEARVRNTFYDNAPFLLRESLVRATCLVHTGDQEGAQRRDEETARQVEAGFEWMPGLVALLGDYRGNRARYPDFTTFEPQLVRFILGLRAQ